MYIGEKNMGYKKGKKELGIYYAKTLVSIAEEISAKNAGKEKAGIQKIFSAKAWRDSQKKYGLSGYTLDLQAVVIHTMGR